MRRRTDVDDADWNAPRRGRGAPEPVRRSRRSLGRRITAWVAVGLVAVLVVGALGAYVKYRSVWDSIKRVDVSGLIGKQPPKYNNAENILLIGSDTRVGKNGKIGGAHGLQLLGHPHAAAHLPRASRGHGDQHPAGDHGPDPGVRGQRRHPGPDRPDPSASSS